MTYSALLCALEADLMEYINGFQCPVSPFEKLWQADSKLWEQKAKTGRKDTGHCRPAMPLYKMPRL